VQLVGSRQQLDKNIETLGNYLHSGSSEEVAFARNLVKRGICFVVTKWKGAPFFSPSRFVGYVDNQLSEHLANADKDGRVTNPAISRILGSDPNVSPELDELYHRFCSNIGVTSGAGGTFGLKRKYWNLS
jgi:putative restriction endonuclease